MDIAKRKQQILSAVIENYIATGEPIGSKALQNTDGLNVSSATIRNDLADLTAIGLLKQPHTSAGRVPTKLGYRYYVERLMRVKPLSENFREYIDYRLRSASNSPESILKTAAVLVSQLTESPAIATTPVGQQDKIHKIKLVQSSRFTAMVILITQAGMVKSRLFRSDFDLTSEILSVFDKVLNDTLSGEPLSIINKPFIQTLATSFGELSLLVPDMLTAVMETCKEANGAGIYTEGATKLLYFSDMDMVWARGVLEFLSEDSNIEKLMQKVPGGTNIYIGDESLPFQLRQSAFTVVKYNIENQSAGAVGVICPIRTDYTSIVAVVEYVAKTVGELISEIISFNI